MSTFSHAGVSRREGELKVRYANSSDRVKVLIKGGHTDIDILELKFPMTKEEAVAYLLSIDFDNGNAEVRACLEEENGRRNADPEAAKEPKPTKERKPRAKKEKQDVDTEKPSLEAIRARAPAEEKDKPLTRAQVLEQLADLDEAPF